MHTQFDTAERVKMTSENLSTAISEAMRFLQRARELDRLLGKREYWSGGPESAAVRRSSMDLTKALAKLRRESM